MNRVEKNAFGIVIGLVFVMLLAMLLLSAASATTLKILCADPIAAAVATDDDCVYARLGTTARIEQVEGTLPTASSAPATKAELQEAVERAFKKAVSK